jgi:uncharacterized protein (TIRG00374 family)
VTRISLVFAAVALVVTIYNTGLDTLGEKFVMIGWWWVAVVVLEIAITTLDAIAIRCFCSPEQDQLRFRDAILSQLAGRSVNAVTPGGNLGEAVKVAVLTEHVSQSRAVSTILLYNVVSFTVELAVVAAAAPVMALLMDMPTSLRIVMATTGVVCFAAAIGLYVLVRRGMLASFVNLLRRLRLIKDERRDRWLEKIRPVDDKMRLVEGARNRDRMFGIVAVTLSRLTSMTLSMLILRAIGHDITPSFVAAYTVGGFVIYMASTLVPMGLGIAETGNYWMFGALAKTVADKGRAEAQGVTLVIARRCTLVLYAGIGLILVTASATVQRARAKAKGRGIGEPATVTNVSQT